MKLFCIISHIIKKCVFKNYISYLVSEKGDVNLLGLLYSDLYFSRALFVICEPAIFNTVHNGHTYTGTSLINHLLDSARKSLALHSYKNVFITTIALSCLCDHKPENSPVMRHRHINL